MDNLGVREVPPREREREKEVLIGFDRHFVGRMEGRRKEEFGGRRRR